MTGTILSMEETTAMAANGDRTGAIRADDSFSTDWGFHVADVTGTPAVGSRVSFNARGQSDAVDVTVLE